MKPKSHLFNTNGYGVERAILVHISEKEIRKNLHTIRSVMYNVSVTFHSFRYIVYSPIPNIFLPFFDINANCYCCHSCFPFGMVSNQIDSNINLNLSNLH